MERIKDFVFDSIEMVRELGFLIISIILGIAMGIYFFNNTKEPATESDYKQLENIVSNISTNHELLFDNDYKVTIKDNVILIENNKCKIKAKYGENFEILAIDRVDKGLTLFERIILSIAMGIVGTIIIPYFVLIYIPSIKQWL